MQLALYFYLSAQAGRTFFSDPDWVTGAVGLAPDGSVAIASSTGDPPKLLFLEPTTKQDHVDVFYASDLFGVDVFMTESISVQNRSNIVIGDGLSSGFSYWTDDSDQTLSRSELYKYTSWAYGGKVALASDGTIATMDPAWNSESVTGLGAIIILSPGLDAQIVFANSPRALAFSANAQTLVIATGSDVVVYERFGDDKSYEAGVGIRLSHSVESLAVSPDAELAVVLYTGIGPCTPCFVDVIDLVTMQAREVRRNPTCGPDTVSAGEKFFTACGKMFSFDSLSEEPIHGHPPRMNVVAVSSDDDTLLFANKTSLELWYPDQPLTQSPTGAPTEHEGSGDFILQKPRVIRPDPVRKSGGDGGGGGGGGEDDYENKSDSGMEVWAVVLICIGGFLVVGVCTFYALKVVGCGKAERGFKELSASFM